MIEDIHIKRYISYTPNVTLKANEGVIKLDGSILGEGQKLKDFFNTIFIWVNEYSQKCNGTITAIFRLNYLNEESEERIYELRLRWCLHQRKCPVVCAPIFRSSRTSVTSSGKSFVERKLLMFLNFSTTLKKNTYKSKIYLKNPT